MNVVVLGLSVTSSWGNGHATTYRGLLREFARRGHEVLFLERDCPWYAGHRDFRQSPDFEIELYESVFDLQERFGKRIGSAEAIVLGSYVPDGIAIGNWLVSEASVPLIFYDIDTPVTIEAIESGACNYLTGELAGKFDLYLSFTGGPLLEEIRRAYDIAAVAPLYCSVDPESYFPDPAPMLWDLGYLGTYSADRQPALEDLLLEPAKALPQRRFSVAGPQYPTGLAWPANVERIEHLGPDQHRRYYAQQRFTLNVTRGAMIRAGYSPSVRLFEAAACETPIISDRWHGIETLFTPGEEILLVESSEDVCAILNGYSEEERRALGRRARNRILQEHTSTHRAAELEQHLSRLIGKCRSLQGVTV